ncbi:hypothetical protein FKP32DRAFT_462249 [Trametes sanguinea]|nr:hypothetical protein FKP32DRAFT_462249 [Trametes sanguinea]
MMMGMVCRWMVLKRSRSPYSSDIEERTLSSARNSFPECNREDLAREEVSRRSLVFYWPALGHAEHDKLPRPLQPHRLYSLTITIPMRSPSDRPQCLTRQSQESVPCSGWPSYT